MFRRLANSALHADVTFLAAASLLIALLTTGLGSFAYGGFGDDRPPPGEKSEPIHLMASGKVVDEKGRPIPGATVYFRELAHALRTATERLAPGYTDVLAETTTNAQGEFVFKDVIAASTNKDLARQFWNPWNLVAVSKGHAIAWDAFNELSKQNVVLRMPSAARIRGRLFAPDGTPAVGVRVQLGSIDEHLDPDSNNRSYSGDELELYGSKLPISVRTDAEGRFVFAGLPQGMRIGLVTEDARFARKYVYAATIDRADIEQLNATPTAIPEWKLLPDGFSTTLQINRSIRGQILYGDTGRPAAGARVSFGMYDVIADEDGRYALEGLEPRKYKLLVFPPSGAAYLPKWPDVTVGEEAPVLRQDFRLARGAILTGQIRDKETGQPLRVAHVGIGYQSDQPFRGSIVDSFETRSDGAFRIVVPPGKGKVYSPSSLPGCIPLDLLGSEFDQFKVAREISVNAGDTLAGVDLFYSKGRTLAGRLRDPDGKPVGGAIFLGPSQQAASAADGTFELRGLSPEQKSEFLVVHPQKQVGAKFVIEPLAAREAPPRDIQLLPTRTARFRVVDEDKRPVPSAKVRLSAYVFMREHDQMTSYQYRPCFGPALTDANGMVTLPALVTEGSYHLHISAKGFALGERHFRVSSGNDFQVPDLVLFATQQTISGIVVDQAGKPVGGVEVSVSPQDQTIASMHRFTSTDSDGRFRFNNLARGQFRIHAALYSPNEEIEKDGRRIRKTLAHGDVAVVAGKKDVRVDLIPER